MAGAGGPGRGRATASCAFLTNASGKCRPACGWEAGRHLVPQLRRGTTLRPFPHRQHARPPLRPRPFGPNVRAILSQAVQGAREPCDPARTLLWCAVPCLRAPCRGAHAKRRASSRGRCCFPPARGLPSATVRSELHFCPQPGSSPLGLRPGPPSAGDVSETRSPSLLDICPEGAKAAKPPSL